MATIKTWEELYNNAVEPSHTDTTKDLLRQACMYAEIDALRAERAKFLDAVRLSVNALSVMKRDEMWNNSMIDTVLAAFDAIGVKKL